MTAGCAAGRREDWDDRAQCRAVVVLLSPLRISH
jgi:hypothetical protein